MQKQFWKEKQLKDFTQEEWESLCDGCGLCCFHKIIDGYLWNKKILNTRVCCNLLDTNTCRCSDYQNRFLIEPNCIKLNRRKLRQFKWLPETCAYRLVYEHKDLPSWHPLITGNPESTKKSGICIQDPIHEQDADDLYDYVI